MQILGKSPIHPVAFVIAKLALLVLFLLAPLGIDQVFGRALPRSPLVFKLAMAILLAGSAIVAVSLLQLGSSARVGLPTEKTRLRTTGLYAVSRNPVYVGGALVCLALCMLTPHWINLACFAIAAVLHHRIVLGEERFLESAFGDQWREYRARVRRYL